MAPAGPGDPLDFLLRRIPLVRTALAIISLNNDMNARSAEFARKWENGELRQSTNKDGFGLGTTIVHNSHTDVGKVGAVPDLNGK